MYPMTHFELEMTLRQLVSRSAGVLLFNLREFLLVIRCLAKLFE